MGTALLLIELFDIQALLFQWETRAMLWKAVSGCIWVKLDLAGARGCGSDLTVDRITARIRGALEVLSVDSLSPTLQSSLMIFSPMLRFSVSDITRHPVTLGKNPGFCVFPSLSLSFFFCCLAFLCCLYTSHQSTKSCWFISKISLRPTPSCSSQCSSPVTSCTGPLGGPLHHA